MAEVSDASQAMCNVKVAGTSFVTFTCSFSINPFNSLILILIHYIVRCRPVNGEEKKTNQPTVVACESETKSIKVTYGPAGKKTSKSFNFDKVFGQYSTQEEVFETVVRPIVQECLEGFNCTIFAYGQTGTGKTHTMEGDIHSEENAGIVPRSVRTILEQLEASGSEFTIRVSFLELYNEELQDLLEKNPGEKKLKLCEDVKKGVVCQNLEEITVLSVKDIFEILQRGIAARQTAATLCNKNSSRSHSIFTMKIMIKECNVEGEEVVRHGQLNLVDLAGSECVGRSGAKNDRAREAGSINQSLLTLGRVITALVDHHGHIPYRDSKLTRLLQESLGGKAKTCIIATLSPSQSAVEETLSTLDYAYRAKNIKNQPTVNQKMTKKVVLKEYCAEIEQLKAQLQLTREKNGVYVDPKEYYNMESKISTQENMLNECESALRVRNEEVKQLKQERDSYQEKIDGLNANLQATTSELDSTKVQLVEVNNSLEMTKLELQASDAVIVEQVDTESMLHASGKGLQDEIIGNRDHINKLFGKIDRFAMREESSMAAMAAYVTDVKSKHATILNDLTNLNNLSSDSSKHLCDGVNEMLAKGRGTCASFQESIDSSLSTLINDAEVARNKMISSCDSVKGDLVSTNEQLAATLKVLQSQLSNWLRDVDSNMQHIQQQLMVQQNQIVSLNESIAHQMDTYNSMNDAYVAQQVAQIESNKSLLTTFKADIVSSIQGYEEANNNKINQLKQELSSQSSNIEKTLSTMLSSMLSSSLNSLHSLAEDTSSFVSTNTALVDTSITKIVDSNAALSEQVTANGKEISEHLSASTCQVVSSISETENTRTDIVSKLTGISSTVGDKIQVLDETVATILTDVSTHISSCCEMVNDTSNTANIILKDVVDATESMKNSSNEAIVAFTSFMDNQGTVLSSDMGDYFSNVSAVLGTSVVEINGVDEMTQSYAGKVNEGVVKATGSTPKKAPFSALSDLPSTRDHNIIKREVKGFPSSDDSSVSDSSNRSSIESEKSVNEEKQGFVAEEDRENANPNTNVGANGKKPSRLQRSKSVLDSHEIIPIRSRSQSSSSMSSI